MGGTITLTGNELGEETVRYCVGNITSGNCEEWVNSTVVVEPEGWDDARVVAVNDEYRLIVNLDSLRLALLRESADGDTTIGGTTYEVLTRLCCLAAGNEYWSVDLELPVMDNDRVVFFREGHPVNKSGHQILFDDLIDGDTIACTGSLFCTMMRPQPDVVPPGIFGMVVGPSYTSLELTVSAPTGNVISEQRVFNYCLAHRENSCGTSPPTCAKATYVESPRAPNAPNLPGIESSENLPARYFEATTLCAGTSGTVTLIVDVYEADDPGLPLIPEEVWETTFEDEFGASRRARCYDRDIGSWSFWTLNPGACGGSHGAVVVRSTTSGGGDRPLGQIFVPTNQTRHVRAGPGGTCRAKQVALGPARRSLRPGRGRLGARRRRSSVPGRPPADPERRRDVRQRSHANRRRLADPRGRRQLDNARRRQRSTVHQGERVRSVRRDVVPRVSGELVAAEPHGRPRFGLACAVGSGGAVRRRGGMQHVGTARAGLVPGSVSNSTHPAHR